MREWSEYPGLPVIPAHGKIVPLAVRQLTGLYAALSERQSLAGSLPSVDRPLTVPLKSTQSAVTGPASAMELSLYEVRKRGGIWLER